MHYSGLLVVARPGQLSACQEQLLACPGLEVPIQEAASERLVAVLEAATVAEHEEGLRRVQRLPSVLIAELVYHYFGDVDDPPPPERTTDP